MSYACPVYVNRFATSVAFAISYGNRIKLLNEKVVLDNQRALFGAFLGIDDIL